MVMTRERDMGCLDLAIKYKDKRDFWHQRHCGSVIRIVRKMTAGTGSDL